MAATMMLMSITATVTDNSGHDINDTDYDYVDYNAWQ
jgi:hypothetical protein